MANILDYVHWRGDLSFLQDKFNILDNLTALLIAASVNDHPSWLLCDTAVLVAGIHVEHISIEIVLRLVAIPYSCPPLLPIAF